MEAVAGGGMASSFRGAGGGAEPEDVAVLVGLTLHREDLSPMDLSKKSYTEAPPEMCERRATHRLVSPKERGSSFPAVV